METPPTKPMSFQSQKTLLQYMDPNLRFKLAHRCPLLRKIEKAIPLTIDTLKFDDTTVTVNDTVYQLRLFNVYVNSDEAPPVLTTETVAHDIDRNGQLEDFSHLMEQGDIDLRTNVERRERDEEIEEERRIDWMFEMSLEMIQERAYDLWHQQQLNDTEETRNRLGELRMENARLRRQHDRARRNRARHHREIPAGELRESYVKLIIDSNGPKYSEEMHYDKKLYEAVKYFNKRIFGGRTNIRVKKLVLEKIGVYRFPLNFKLKIDKEVEFPGTFDFGKLNHIISSDNYGSTILTINVKQNDDMNWDQDAIKNAKMLRIQNHTDDTTDLLEKLENKDVIFLQNYDDIPQRNPVKRLIEHWRENGRAVGTKFRIGYSSLGSVKESLNLAEHDFQCLTPNQELLIPMEVWNTRVRVHWEQLMDNNDFPYLVTLQVENAP